MDNDEQRDSAEEAYWRAFCPACGESPCMGPVCDQGRADEAADLVVAGAVIANMLLHPEEVQAALGALRATTDALLGKRLPRET